MGEVLTVIKDQYARPLRDLRISVTDRCNFRCRYCMPEELFGPDFKFLPRERLMSFEEMTRLIRCFVPLGVEKIRITGGEPLLRKDIDELISMIRHVQEIKDIAMTTNGSLLAKYADRLKQAGLDRVTVSIDSLDQNTFGKMNGVNYQVSDVLEGIEKATEAGLGVKLNMVVQRGVNDQDILPMAKFFKEKGITLRFIEFMDVGNSNNWKLDQVVPSKEIHDLIHSDMPIEPVNPNYFGEVAKRYRYVGTDVEIGFISSVTQTFCSSCTRARLSAEGHLYTCLFASKGFDLLTPLRNTESDKEIMNLITDRWNARDDRYSEIRLNNTSELKRSKVEMSHIGG